MASNRDYGESQIPKKHIYHTKPYEPPQVDQYNFLGKRKNVMFVAL